MRAASTRTNSLEKALIRDRQRLQMCGTRGLERDSERLRFRISYDPKVLPGSYARKIFCASQNRWRSRLLRPILSITGEHFLKMSET